MNLIPNIFARARVLPDLIGGSCRRSLRLSDSWGLRAFTHVFLVRSDPLGGYLALGGLEIQLAGAYELIEFALERIFHVRVLGRRLG